MIHIDDYVYLVLKPQKVYKIFGPFHVRGVHLAGKVAHLHEYGCTLASNCIKTLEEARQIMDKKNRMLAREKRVK